MPSVKESIFVLIFWNTPAEDKSDRRNLLRQKSFLKSLSRQSQGSLKELETGSTIVD